MQIYLWLFRTAFGCFVQRCNKDLWIVVSFFESSYFCMLESLHNLFLCQAQLYCTWTHSMYNSLEKVLLEHGKTHSTCFAIYSNYTGICSHSLSREKKSQSESMSIRQSHTDLLLLSLSLVVTVVLLVFSSTKLCIAGQVGASDIPLLSFSCLLPLPSCPSHPAPDGIIIVIILCPSHPLSLSNATTCSFYPENRRIKARDEGMQGGKRFADKTLN